MQLLELPRQPFDALLDLAHPVVLIAMPSLPDADGFAYGEGDAFQPVGDPVHDIGQIEGAFHEAITARVRRYR